MCGIAGFFDQRALGEEAEGIAARMGTAIAHRGPDDSGTWVDAETGIGLAHRRLAIIDPSPAGHQPMISATGRYVLSFNGEIYNFQELRREIERIGGAIAWRSHCDTEVLLAAIDRWGIADALPRLNGMFAFALWDRSRRVLTLARDRFGEKPLYYGSTGDAFLFGSELKALQAHPAFRGSLDRASVAGMLRSDYVPAPRTIWEGIAKLPPGHFVEISSGGRRIARPVAYWSLEDVARRGLERPFRAGPELAAELDTLLKDAVGRQMLADVPLGAFLSGGIDSSLIVALMQAQSPRAVRTFTIGFEDPRLDEAPFARAVAGHLGCDHTELYVSGQDALDVIPGLPRIWDEPLGDQAAIPTFLVSALTRRHVKVALSGDGGDELFGGYSRYRSTWRTWQRAGRIPQPLRRALGALTGANGRALVPGNAGRAARMLSSGSLEDLYEWKRSRVERADHLVLGVEPALMKSLDPAAFLADQRARMMFWDSMDYLPDDILTKVDRASMAVSLEVRAPFLDHRVAEFAWALPMSAKMDDRAGKLILRQLLGQYLPGDLTSRRKMGFAVPMTRWLKGPLRPWAEDLLSEARLTRQAILDKDAVRSLWRDFLGGRARHDRILWNILSFQSWLDAAHQPGN
ncbi:MAG TPA: asparagine synthase (glutamine-hydrolyzing) [Sphingomicrobium sp.]